MNPIPGTPKDEGYRLMWSIAYRLAEMLGGDTGNEWDTETGKHVFAIKFKDEKTRALFSFNLGVNIVRLIPPGTPTSYPRECEIEGHPGIRFENMELHPITPRKH